MSKVYLSLDCGKSDTKVVVRNADGTTTQSKIPTKISDTPTEMELTGGATIVEFEGVKYAIGSLKAFTDGQNSKKNYAHKIAGLYSIANAVKDYDTVAVAIGCPLSTYENAEARQELLDYLLPVGDHTIVINGTIKHFTISPNRIIIPESYGARYLYSNLFADRLTGIIDIGGLNATFTYFNDGKYDEDRSSLNNLGVLSLSRVLTNKLNKELDKHYSIDQVVQFMANNSVQGHDDTHGVDYFEARYKERLAEIIKKCQDLDWDIDSTELIFIGGGAELFSDIIRKEFPNAFVPGKQCEFTNAQGFLKKLCELAKVNVQFDI